LQALFTFEEAGNGTRPLDLRLKASAFGSTVSAHQEADA
jgi:hypothetical protein